MSREYPSDKETGVVEVVDEITVNVVYNICTGDDSFEEKNVEVEVVIYSDGSSHYNLVRDIPDWSVLWPEQSRDIEGQVEDEIENYFQEIEDIQVGNKLDKLEIV